MAKESKDGASKRSQNQKELEERQGHDTGMNTGVAIIGFILCGVAGAGLMWGYDAHRMKSGDISADDSTSGSVWSDKDSPVPIDSKDPMWGVRSAPVTIVQFSDYQCPYCSKVELTMDQVKKTYGPDKVRVIWKNEPLPFHPNAKPAAEAAQGVFALKGNDAFWKFHDTAFKNQSALSDDSYAKWATESGVDMPKFKAGLAAHKWADKVEKDHADAKTAGVNGTPAFFINGVSLSGAQPFEKFKAVIDQELGKAQAKIAAGTPKDKIYVTMSTENKKAPAPAEDDGEEKEDSKTVWKVPVGKSPIQGSDKALVTIIEFSDFQCPYCKKVEDSLKKVKADYGDKVRLVWKHEPLPFHPRAEPAAELTNEARAEKGDKGFWEAHDRLFDSQPKLEDADLDKIAADMGLNADKVKSARTEHRYKKDVDADQDVADDFAASGTPHFFVNGRRLVGAQPYDKFKKIIDEEVTRAQGLLAKGTAQADLYDALIKDGKGTPDPEKKNVPLLANAPSRGNANAKVVIQEFSDFQCPYCSKAEDSVNEVMKNYGDKVKFVWRNMPLPMHADAPLAAQASMEAYKQKGSDGFWKMHDLLYGAQKTEGGLKREALDKYAQQLGLNMDKWKTALDTQSHKAEVDADAKAGNDAGISGTPAFLINGYFINGAQPFGKFRKLIDKALADPAGSQAGVGAPAQAKEGHPAH
jgi:protein-disulfide isomerase